MTIKIDKPKGCMVVWDLSEKPIPVRIVRESDWRKIMAVVRAAEQDEVARSFRQYDATPLALDELRKHRATR